MNPLAVVAGVIRRDGRVLIARRRPERDRGGLWEFPGGKIERGETPEQALERELKEELDCRAEVERIYDARLNEYPEKTVLVLFYLCRVKEGQPRAVDPDGIVWVNENEILSYEFAEADTPVARRINGEGIC